MRGQHVGALVALAAGACTAPDPVRDGTAGLTTREDGGRQDPIAEHAQEAFLAWADGLPAESQLPPMRINGDFAIRGNMQDWTGEDFNFDGSVTPQDLSFAMTWSVTGELQDWRHFRARMDVSFDFAPLREQSGGRPTVLGCDLIGDGATLWIQPDWSNSWFLDEMRRESVGVENMVFSLRMDTMQELLDVSVLAVPEANREVVRAMFECAANPACLARLIARSATILSFQHAGDRVIADVEYAPDFWTDSELAEDNPFVAMFGAEAFRYRMEFDAATGANLRSEATGASAAGAMSFHFLSEVADDGFPAEAFRFEPPAGRKVFPVDVFMRPVIHQLRAQAGLAPDSAGDFEF